MNRIVCPRGHFYDADKYPQCPHCADGTAAVRQDYSAFAQNGVFGGMQDGAQNGLQNGEQGYSADRRDDQVTLILPAEYLPDSGSAQDSFASGEQETFSQGQRLQAWTREFSQLAQEAEQDRMQDRETQSMDMRPGGGAALDQEEILPPVGYLVCIRGRDYGRGFPLKTGVNTVKGQAHVLYEPRRREFYLKPVDNDSLCYCNDEVLLEPRKVQDYDRITVGDTVFLLVAVCGEKFCWEEVV